ncbi:C-C motif chemokine 4 homolog isoform X1 [Erpetoichthys calabaricus]|uniref:C-C motif chemokine 4 homolog isoform X1 n=1 Tax=Erpetoichthys calabaricus TaxID=27687 RepID=UPI00109F864B|nr:C-C motif chemokine 4 homolog isoform X1 [Erpetoichthys calabaricus]
MKMQSCFLVAVALILGTVCSEVLAQHFNANKPDECCFNFQQKQVPRHFFVGYVTLRDDCPSLGVILVAENGKRVCANPKYAWVKRHMNYFDQQAPKGSGQTPK